MHPEIRWENSLCDLDIDALNAQLDHYTTQWDRALGIDQFGAEAAELSNKVRAIRTAIAFYEPRFDTFSVHSDPQAQIIFRPQNYPPVSEAPGIRSGGILGFSQRVREIGGAAAAFVRIVTS